MCGRQNSTFTIILQLQSISCSSQTLNTSISLGIQWPNYSVLFFSPLLFSLSFGRTREYLTFWQYLHDCPILKEGKSPNYMECRKYFQSWICAHRWCTVRIQIMLLPFYNLLHFHVFNITRSIYFNYKVKYLEIFRKCYRIDRAVLSVHCEINEFSFWSFISFPTQNRLHYIMYL